VYDDPEVRDVTEISDHLRRLYAAFNARDIEAIAGLLNDDVRRQWLRGRFREVRGEPLAYQTRADGRIAVIALFAEQPLRHVFAFEDGLVRAIEVDDTPNPRLEL
jgi:hypothetical protein